MPFLSPRQELIRLQKQIYKKNKELIQESVIHEGKSFKAYEKRYLAAVRDFQRICSIDDAMKAILKADIVYVGDYHTLNQSQRSLLRVLRQLIQETDQFVLGLEIVQARHQPVLDRYMSGKLADETFLKKTQFREHWFFDLWNNFKPIFDFAKENKVPVFGVEADPRKEPSLKQRDEAMAQHIRQIRLSNPGKKIIIFVGDLHLAPCHLPQEVKRAFKPDKVQLKTVLLYQNSDSIYWKLAERKKEDLVHVVQISENEFCRMHTPPIICQQSYLNWLYNEEGVLDYADAKQTFLGYMEQIAKFLEIKLGPEIEEVEVFTSGDLSFLKRLRESHAFTAKEIKEIKRQILRSESYTIPKMKFAYLANVSVNHAAEEAAHTVRYFCAGEEFPRVMQDAFYANILHEAMGFFGSKIVNHKRKCLRPSDCRKAMSYFSSRKAIVENPSEFRMAALFLEHEKGIGKKLPFYASKIKGLSTDLFLGLTHAIGYYLGEQMFYALIQGKISKETIRDLFYDPMDDEGEPLRRYLELVESVRQVKLPQKV